MATYSGSELQQDVSRSSRQNQSNIDDTQREAISPTSAPSSRVYVSPSGVVRSSTGATYGGTTIVPGTGKSASELQKEARAQSGLSESELRNVAYFSYGSGGGSSQAIVQQAQEEKTYNLPNITQINANQKSTRMDLAPTLPQGSGMIYWQRMQSTDALGQPVSTPSYRTVPVFVPTDIREQSYIVPTEKEYRSTLTATLPVAAKETNPLIAREKEWATIKPQREKGIWGAISYPADVISARGEFVAGKVSQSYLNANPAKLERAEGLKALTAFAVTAPLYAVPYVGEGLGLSAGVAQVSRAQTQTQAAMGLGVIGLSAYGAYTLPKRMAELQVSRGLRTLKKQSYEIVGAEKFRNELGSGFSLKAIKGYGFDETGKLVATRSAREISDITLPVIPTSKTTFSTTGLKVKGFAEIDIKSIFGKVKETRLVRIDAYGSGRGTLSPNLPKRVFGNVRMEMEGFEGAYGSGYLIERGSKNLIPYKYAGAVAERGGYYWGIGGKANKIISEGIDTEIGIRSVNKQMKGLFKDYPSINTVSTKEFNTAYPEFKNAFGVAESGGANKITLRKLPKQTINAYSRRGYDIIGYVKQHELGHIFTIDERNIYATLSKADKKYMVGKLKQSGAYENYLLRGYPGKESIIRESLADTFAIYKTSPIYKKAYYNLQQDLGLLKGKISDRIIREARKKAVISYDVPIIEKRYYPKSVQFKPSQFSIVKQLKPNQQMFNLEKETETFSIMKGGTGTSQKFMTKTEPLKFRSALSSVDPLMREVSNVLGQKFEAGLKYQPYIASSGMRTAFATRSKSSRPPAPSMQLVSPQEFSRKNLFYSPQVKLQSQSDFTTRLKMPQLQMASFEQQGQYPMVTQITETRPKLKYQQLSTTIPMTFGGKGFDTPFNPFVNIPAFSLGLDTGGSYKPKGKRKKGKVAPSFTAVAFNLKGMFPKSGKFGISPFKIRLLPKKFKQFNLGI